MIVFRYDRSFEGLLTVLFDAYFRKQFPEKLIVVGEPEPMFCTELHEVATDQKKAARVWNGIISKMNKRACNMLMYVWLSEEEGSDWLIYSFVKKLFDDGRDISYNFADSIVLEVNQLAHKVSREGSYLRQFIRFQKGGDGTFFAPVEPRYNSMPLVINYLKDRFADQKWMVYDKKRRYGFYYDLKKVVEITMEKDVELVDGKLSDELMADDEKMFQHLWKSYFKALTIKERKNPKLQRQHMPRRFWKYLPEMK